MTAAYADTTTSNEPARLSGKPATRWYRANLWLHRWCSLVATVPFLILCLTGTVLIFHHEIDEWLDPVPVATVSDKVKPLAESVQAAAAAHEAGRVLSVGIDADEHPGVLAVFTVPLGDTDFENFRLHYMDIATARSMGTVDDDMSLTEFLLELHARWFLGPVGEVIGALIALLVLLSLLSGLVVYAPHVRRVAFGVLRRGRGPRLLQLDLHNLIGAVVLGWALVVTFTGFLLGFSTVALGIWQMTELAELRRQYDSQPAVDVRNPPADIDRVFAAAKAAAPAGWQINSVFFPGADLSTPSHYTVLLSGAAGLDERMLEVMMVDARSGEVARVVELPLYMKAILISQPLHFGDYGGLPLKLLWTLLTWFTLFITANGAWLWWDRRRPKRVVASTAAEAMRRGEIA